MGRFFNMRSLVIGGLVLLTAWAAAWGIRKWSAPKLETVRAVSASPLFEPRDKPMTIFLKTVETETGHPQVTSAVIRQSKSRYNQMKQAVLAYLQGPRSGKAQVPVPEGMALNELYFTPQGAAVVDLSMAGVNPDKFGFYEESLFIRGIIEVLSRNFFEIKQVKVLVDGRDAPVLGGHYGLGTSESSAPVSAAGTIQ